MIEAIGTALNTVIGWVGTVITSLTAQSGGLSPLLPLFAVGIAVSALLFGIRAIRSFAWGA